MLLRTSASVAQFLREHRSEIIVTENAKENVQSET
jgi:hypothetical protein